ncbi:MAG: pectate lyase family protein [Terrimicrobiaceae bacterium]
MHGFSLARLRTATVFLAGFLLLTDMRGQDGFAEKATGGAGGATVTVRTAEEFAARVKAPEVLTVAVEGNLEIGTVSVASHKTIVGASPGATLIGNLFIGPAASNVIVKNLNFTNPMGKNGKGGGDGVTIRGAKLVWVTQCTFFDCGDGCVDVTEGADWVTVSWCKFFFTKQPKHRFTMIAAGRDKDRKKREVKNKLNITLHHNWWADRCESRMPSATKAKLHMYNNYFTCEGNSYCSNARDKTELLSENNYYQGVRNPLYTEDGAKLKTSGNVFEKCTGMMERKNEDVFDPPYEYSPDKADKVPAVVRAGAGAR